MQQQPSIGRVVHVVDENNSCRAATITEVYRVIDLEEMRHLGVIAQMPDLQIDADGTVTTIGVCVLHPSAIAFEHAVRYSEERTVGTWHWPERA